MRKLEHVHEADVPTSARGRLNRLLREAVVACAARAVVPMFEEGCEDNGAGRRARAGDLLATLLARPVPRRACRAALLTRITTRAHLASRNVRQLETRIADVPLSSRQTRAVGVAIAELIHFADACAEEGRTIDLFVVIEQEGNRVILGLAVVGGYQLVASAQANRALLRARSITEAMGGDFQRGADAERMIVGIVLPLPDTESCAVADGAC